MKSRATGSADVGLKQGHAHLAQRGDDIGLGQGTGLVRRSKTPPRRSDRLSNIARSSCLRLPRYGAASLQTGPLPQSRTAPVGANALTDGDPGPCPRDRKHQPPGNWGGDTPDAAASQACGGSCASQPLIAASQRRGHPDEHRRQRARVRVQPQHGAVDLAAIGPDQPGRGPGGAEGRGFDLGPDQPGQRQLSSARGSHPRGCGSSTTPAARSRNTISRRSSSTPRPATASAAPPAPSATWPALPGASIGAPAAQDPRKAPARRPAQGQRPGAGPIAGPGVRALEVLDTQGGHPAVAGGCGTAWARWRPGVKDPAAISPLRPPPGPV
jgi:hypothetical protein